LTFFKEYYIRLKNIILLHKVVFLKLGLLHFRE
jgi:hypothetical protein